MLVISAQQVDETLTFPSLVEALRAAFSSGAIQPVRHHHTVERASGADSTLLLMPAWTDFARAADGYIGVKIVTVSPDNNTIGKPAVMGQYLLMDGRSGQPLALIDGQRLTQWRTACASALAATYLAREGSSRLLVIGAGAIGGFLARAHAAVRPIREIRVWNRTPENAGKTVQTLRELGFDASVADSLDESMAWADIVSAATISTQPLVSGRNLSPGAHVDLVGGFTPAMREADDETIRRAQVYVDTRAGATAEAGDIVQPLASGVLAAEDIVGDLSELTRGTASGRSSEDAVTLFKSVGAAIEDLAAAIAVYEAVRR